MHGWERFGKLLTTLARRVLYLPVQRYVDDLFAPERPECLVHAKNCFARFTRILLGPDAIEERKLEHGMDLVVLGTQIQLSVDGFNCKPALKTIIKCLIVIEAALASGIMLAGDAQKLAGRLNWSTQRLFHRLGRAMLRPIYMQKYSRLDCLCFLALCVFGFSVAQAGINDPTVENSAQVVENGVALRYFGAAWMAAATAAAASASLC